MRCSKCGAELPEGAESCPACGAATTAASADEKSTSGFTTTKRAVIYAGFWLRAIAYLLDSFILGISLQFVIAPILRNNQVGPSLEDFWKFYSSSSRQSTAFVLLVQLADWLYYAAFESSAWQATPGKKILKLKVTDVDGHRISFARASGRHFGKFISTFSVLVGFAMAGFTERKQALHDKMAGCLVVRSL